MISLLRIACVLVALTVRADAAGRMAAVAQRIDQADVSAAIERFVASEAGVPEIGRLLAREEVRAFYAARDFSAAWLAAGRPTTGAEEIERLVAAAPAEGLDPAEYHASAIELMMREVERATSSFDPQVAVEHLAALDIVLTDAFLAMAADRARGRIEPVTIHPGWNGRRSQPDAAALLARTLASGGTLMSALAALDPVTSEYAVLRQALAAYRTVAEAGGWPVVPATRVLRAGDNGPEIARLRARLWSEPGIGAPAVGAAALAFDARVDAAVRAFQRRHGLAVDGVVGPRTFAALNVPARVRVEQIELALERLRWLPRPLPATRIVVLMPAFELEAVRPGETPLRMRVVGGRAGWPTPVLTDVIEQVAFRPYWNVPTSIVRAEVLPGLGRDAGYLAHHDMEVRIRTGDELRIVDPAAIDWSSISASDARYLFRQRPGPENPLGLIKFVMPNAAAIALHDTPARAAFELPLRTASHGCIRVQDAARLAEWLLAGQGWTAESVRIAMTANESRVVDLQAPVATMLLYRTVWADASGALRFGPDVYGLDNALAAALRARRSASTESRREVAKGVSRRVTGGPPHPQL